MLSAPRALLGAASRVASNLRTPNVDTLSVVLPLTATCCTHASPHACQSAAGGSALFLSASTRGSQRGKGEFPPVQHFSTSAPPPRHGFTRKLRTAAAMFTALSGAAVAYTALSPAPKLQQDTQQQQDANSNPMQDAASVAAVTEDGSSEGADAGLLQADPAVQEQNSMDAHPAGPWHTDAEMQLHLHRR
eukprot:scaffold22414_cov18-Tisochrysis_lutea.AAC.1